MAKSSDNKSPYLYRRIVAKFGTSLLTGGADHLDLKVMSDLSNQIAYLHQQGIEVIIVSSGAIASGRYKLGLKKKIRGIPYKQVLAAVGQSRLMSTYENLFNQYGITIAQALLTRRDLCDRAGYINARNTLLTLMEFGVVCIINENDVVAVEELQGTRFGDNDNLSAMVANLVDADLLLILSDIAGLYTADPHSNPGATLIPEVKTIDESIFHLAAGTNGMLGTGGMITKLQAARLATACGTTVVIAQGDEPGVIRRVAFGEAVGTRFLAVDSKRESRERWLLSGLSTKGKLVVDAGATEALRKKNGSLLAAGIRDIEGNFQRGDIVNIFDSENNRVGSGITNYCSEDIDRIKGLHSRKIADILGYDYGSEVVHRNNLVLV